MRTTSLPRCAIVITLLLLPASPLLCEERSKTLDELRQVTRLVIDQEFSSCVDRQACKRRAVSDAEAKAKKRLDKQISHEIRTSPYIDPNIEMETRIISSKTKIIRESGPGHQGYGCSVAVWLEPMLSFGGSTFTSICPDVSESDCYSIRGKDRHGKTADFRIYIMSNEFNWRILETTEVEQGGRSVDLLRFLSMPGVMRVMQSATDLVAVGTASYEGARLKEEARAGERANQLVTWLRESVSFADEPPGIHYLNIGKFMKRGSYYSARTTAYQRKIILIAVLSKDEGVALKAALYSALKGRNLDRFTMDNYSKGQWKVFDYVQKN